MNEIVDIRIKGIVTIGRLHTLVREKTEGGIFDVQSWIKQEENSKCTWLKGSKEDIDRADRIFHLPFIPIITYKKEREDGEYKDVS